MLMMLCVGERGVVIKGSLFPSVDEDINQISSLSFVASFFRDIIYIYIPLDFILYVHSTDLNRYPLQQSRSHSFDDYRSIICSIIQSTWPNTAY